MSAFYSASAGYRLSDTTPGLIPGDTATVNSREKWQNLSWRDHRLNWLLEAFTGTDHHATDDATDQDESIHESSADSAADDNEGVSPEQPPLASDSDLPPEAVEEDADSSDAATSNNTAPPAPEPPANAAGPILLVPAGQAGRDRILKRVLGTPPGAQYRIGRRPTPFPIEPMTSPSPLALILSNSMFSEASATA